MKDVLEGVDAVNAPSSLKCDVCDDNKKHIILTDLDECLCSDCYVNRYGWKSLLKYYNPITKSDRL